MKTIRLKVFLFGLPPALAIAGAIAGVASGAAAVTGTVAQLAAGSGSVKNNVEVEDPRQIAFLSEMDKRRNSYLTGSAASQLQRKIGQNSSAIKNGIMTTANGDTSSAMSALARLSAGQGMAQNEVLANSEASGLAYQNAYQGVLDKTAARKFQLGLSQYAQDRLDKTTLLGAGVDNLMALGTGALANVGGVGGAVDTISSNIELMKAAKKKKAFDKALAASNSGGGDGKPIADPYVFNKNPTVETTGYSKFALNPKQPNRVQNAPVGSKYYVQPYVKTAN